MMIHVSSDKLDNIYHQEAGQNPQFVPLMYHYIRVTESQINFHCFSESSKTRLTILVKNILSLQCDEDF